MKSIWMALAVVLVIRYFSIDSERLLAVRMSYGDDMAHCRALKVQIDEKPDPPGTKTQVDCVFEQDLPKLLGGQDT